MKTFHLIPHVHWDREWYLSRAGFLARLVPMMDGLLELLESDPALRFHLDGQMVLVEDYLGVVPDARGTIEALVRRGQLAVGPWYVLADELIPSGASLRRNLEIGIRMARELGGECPVLYSPDAFGHPASLPSLAADFGIGSAVVWRGLGRPGGRERDLYRWVGPDDRAVTTYHLPPSGYETGIGLVDAGDALEERWLALRTELVGRAVTDQIAVFVGADHHAPEPALGLLARRIAALEPEARVRFSSLAEYFAAVAKAAPALEEIRGELRHSPGYVWSLQGVHASRARQKRRHGQVERFLHQVAAPLDRLAGGRHHRLLDVARRQLLQCQFHDTLAGTVADEVAAEQDVRLESVVAIGEQLARDGLHHLIGHDPDQARQAPDATGPVLAVWNPNRAAHEGVVVAETTWFDGDVLVGPPDGREAREGLGYRAFHLVGPAGTPIPVQILRVEPGFERVDAPRHYPDLDQVDRVWIAAWLDEVNGREAVRLEAVEGALAFDGSIAGVSPHGAGFTNGFVSLAIGPDGFPAVVDELRGTRCSRLFGIETEADLGDLYTPDIRPGSMRPARILGVRTLAEGPLVAAIEWVWQVSPATGGWVAGRTVVSLRAGEPMVRIRVELDNQAANHRLRIRLPLGLQEVDVGTPLGTVRRGPGRLDRSWTAEAVLPTAPASEFIASPDADRPLRVEASGFLEYELDSRGEVHLTMLRAVGELSVPAGSCRRGNAGWALPTPAAQEPGHHVMEFRLRFESGPGPLDVLPLYLRNATPPAR
ncbi:MAG: hypothetical protein AB7L66_10205 [Gemmatimonadales bacterium]